MTSLIVTLPDALPTAALPCSAVLAADDGSVLRHEEVPLALLAGLPPAEVVALVQVRQLSWHRVTLPRGTLGKNMFRDGSAARLRAILEGQLEDQLLDEPGLLHFALEPQAAADAPTWVAACDRAWLAAWLAALEQAGRPVSRVVPEWAPASASPADGGTVAITGSADAPQLVHVGANGVTVLPLNSASVALVQTTLADAPAPGVLAEPGVAELAQQHFQGHITLQSRHQHAALAAQSAWDLAQFDLLRTRSARTRKQLSGLAQALWQAPQWRAARWAVLLLLVINLVGLQTWSWREQAALQTKRAAVRDTLTGTFPDVKVVIDAPLQMARALADLQRQSGTASGADLETMLSQFQAAAPATQGPSAIEYVAGELRLKNVAKADEWDATATRLRAAGYEARLEGDSVVMKQERRP